MKPSILLLSLSLSLLTQAELLFIGTNTGGDSTSKGIYSAKFDPSSGELSELKLVAEARNPGFLAYHPDKALLYAVGPNTVSAYSFTPEAELTLLNTAPADGQGCCHLALHPSGNALATANYGDGSISSFRLRADGSIDAPANVLHNTGKSIHPRQQGPHAHGVYFIGDTLLVPDLGLDKILGYQFDPGESADTPPTAADPAFTVTAPGDGPRHLAIHPDGKHLFAIHELSNMAEAYRVNDAKLTSTDRASTLPSDWEGENTTAEIAVHPDGQWVFASNRGHDSIAVFHFDSSTGKLNRKAIVPCGAKTPRHFTISPDGKWLLAAGQNSNDIHVLSFDPETGELKLTAESLSAPRPICLKFLPKNR